MHPAAVHTSLSFFITLINLLFYNGRYFKFMPHIWCCRFSRNQSIQWIILEAASRLIHKNLYIPLIVDIPEKIIGRLNCSLMKILIKKFNVWFGSSPHIWTEAFCWCTGFPKIEGKIKASWSVSFDVQHIRNRKTNHRKS